MAALLPLGAGELPEEVLKCLTDDVFGTVLLVTKGNVVDEVDELAKSLLIQARVRIDLAPKNESRCSVSI